MERVFSPSRIRVLNVFVVFALFVVCVAGCGDGNSSIPTTGPLAVGSWGGSLNTTNNAVVPATLTVTASGGQMAITCQRAAQYSGTVILDSTGHFSVTGTSTPCCTPVIVPTRYDGSVQNNVMTITLTNTNNNANLGTYTLKFEQAAPTQNVGCPG
ncbi:MAG: hypothetical protein JWL77_5175 [Chthonomonadaceae bacterium]|nr:hypothetical protein [Chthonomonadaceae bacterium]